VDITTPGSTTPTMQDTLTGLSWSNKRPYATWQGAIDHCSALTYNGVSGWRLPTQTELMNAYAHGIVSAARANWMTLGGEDRTNMEMWFWSTSSYSGNTNNAWFVNLGYRFTSFTSKSTNVVGVVCVR
jgi:hypothetical protein